MSLLTPAELAAHLRISERTVTRMVQDGCPSLLVGARRRFDLAAVIAWTQERSSALAGRAPAATRSAAADSYTAAYRKAKLRVMPGGGKP